MEIKKYRAGNCLRGYYDGEFSSIEEAWSHLSMRILYDHPTDAPNGVRSIALYVKERNRFDYNQFILCKLGVTERNNLTLKEVLKKCKAVGSWLI